MKVARMLAENLAASLASASGKLFDDAAAEGMEPTLVAGLLAAYDAFHGAASEAAVEQLRAQIFGEVRDGLAQLDEKKE